MQIWDALTWQGKAVVLGVVVLAWMRKHPIPEPMVPAFGTIDGDELEDLSAVTDHEPANTLCVAVPRSRVPARLPLGAGAFPLLFVLLWLYARRPRATGQVSGVFLIGYGVFRFGVEYTREPDSFLGFLALGLTMGQWLSLPMVLAGAGLLAWSLTRPR